MWFETSDDWCVRDPYGGTTLIFCNITITNSVTCLYTSRCVTCIHGLHFGNLRSNFLTTHLKKQTRHITLGLATSPTNESTT